MTTSEAESAISTSEIGTPLDYTSDVYQVYFELSDAQGIARHIIADFLGESRASGIASLAHGYVVSLPIQCVPDVVRRLSAQNIAIYQVVRYAKTTACWS